MAAYVFSPGVPSSTSGRSGISRPGQFGGNSNWRGPVWFPLNYLVIGTLRRLHAGLGDAFTVELPTGSGRLAHLGTVADDLERRLLGLFLPDGTGRRPIWGSCALFREDPAWRDELLFHEYFDGETGEGLGASHPTGWTALAAALIAERSTAPPMGPRPGSHEAPTSWPTHAAASPKSS